MPDRSFSATYDYLINKYGLTLTWEQAAEELGLHWETVRKMCQRGEIPAKRAGRVWVLTTKALAEYIDQRPIEQNVVPMKRKKYVVV
jgi:excisionase family DNA binding protein